MKKALTNWPFWVFSGLIGIYLIQYTLCLMAQFWTEHSGAIMTVLLAAGAAVALGAFLRFRRNRNNDDGGDDDGGQHVHIHVHYD